MEKWYVVDDGGQYNVLNEDDIVKYGVEKDQIIKVTNNMKVAFNLADKLNREAEENSSDFQPMRGYYNESKLNESINDCFYGCPNIKIRWHGEWSDPEVMANGYLANYYEVEDAISSWAERDGIDVNDKNAFAQYIQNNEKEVAQYISQIGEKEDNPFEMQENKNVNNNKNMAQRILKEGIVDREGNPYIEDESWPAGGGLDDRCSFNQECLKAFDFADFEKMQNYLKKKGFKIVSEDSYSEVWEKGDTRVYYDGYEDGSYGYMRTEYIANKMQENKNVNNNKNMAQTIKLNEEKLRSIISESIKKVINESEFNEEEMDEGWLGDKWNQMKTAANTFTQKNDAPNFGLKDRFNKAKANWNTQGELNDIRTVKEMLSKLIADKQINPNVTVGQLVGTANKFGKISGMMANRQGQIARRGGTAN